VVPVPTALPNPFRNIGCRHPDYSITTSSVAMVMSVGLSMAVSPIGRPPGPPRGSVDSARRRAEWYWCSACRESFSGTSVPRRVFNCAHIAETSIKDPAIDRRGHRLLERTNCQVASGYNSTPVIRDVTLVNPACGISAIALAAPQFRSLRHAFAFPLAGLRRSPGNRSQRCHSDVMLIFETGVSRAHRMVVWMPSAWRYSAADSCERFWEAGI
jgi:hypothetical protein